MLAFKFFIFASFMAGYAYCMSVECHNLRLMECSNYDVEEEGLPETVVDLQLFCIKLIFNGRCILKVIEKCAKDEDFVDDENDVELFRKTLEFVESSCIEDSEVFMGIAYDLDCTVTTMRSMDDICRWNGINVTLVENLLSDIGEGKICTSDAWIYNCLKARFDVECGSRARDAVSQILDNTNDYVSLSCKETREKLPFLEQIFNSEFRQGKKGKSALPGIIEAITKKVD